MSAFRRFLRRLVHFFQPGRAEPELEREIAAHLDVLEDEFRRRGLSGADARLAARRALGGAEQAKERHRDARSFRWLNDLRQDTRFAMRAVGRAPGFAAVVAVTLALGIGANTAIFSVVHAVLLRDLPYPGADRFVRIALQFEPDDGSGTKTFAAPVSLQDLELLRSRSRTVSHLGTYGPEAATLSGRGEAVHLAGLRVSPQVLEMLQATPLMGRLLDPREEAPGLEHVVVVSYAMWQRRLAGDDGIVGKAIELNGTQYQVVGVMRQGFHFPDADTEFWVPYVWPPGAQPVIVGRMNAGGTFQAASAEVNDLLQAARRTRSSTGGAPRPPAPPPPPGVPTPPAGPTAGPPAPPGAGPPPPPGGGPAAGAPARNPGPVESRFVVVSLQHELVTGAMTPLVILSCAVGFVLLIACVNVSGLLLAHGARREREIWVRLALGAGRSRVLRQLLTESLCLTVLGGGAGVWLAVVGVRWLRVFGAAMPRQDLGATSIVPRLEEVSVDGTVLLFAVGVSLIVGLACGLAPALWYSRAGARGELAREGGASPGGVGPLRRSRGRALLVVVQVGLAVVLLLGSGLLVRSFVKLSSINPGYATARVVTFQVALSPGQSALTFATELAARLQGLPGVRAAGYADHLPLARSNLGHVLLGTRFQSSQSMVPPPPPPPPGAAGKPGFPIVHLVSRDFLAALGVDVVEGHGFSDDDPVGPPHSLLINRTLARSGFLGEHPVGMRVYTGGEVPWDVIGVVEDYRQTGLADPPGPEISRASIDRGRPTPCLAPRRRTSRCGPMDRRRRSFRRFGRWCTTWIRARCRTASRPWTTSCRTRFSGRGSTRGCSVCSRSSQARSRLSASTGASRLPSRGERARSGSGWRWVPRKPRCFAPSSATSSSWRRRVSQSDWWAVSR